MLTKDGRGVRRELFSGAYPQMILRFVVTSDDKDVPHRPLPEVLE
ncbi:hypothetical protein ABGB18_40725 [Nonomuraea sp. B12E4]